jgi:hypothetical protein
MKKIRIRHAREGGYPSSLKKSGFPTTTSGMTTHKYQLHGSNEKRELVLYRDVPVGAGDEIVKSPYPL